MQDIDILNLISALGVNFVFLILFIREQGKVAEIQQEWTRYQTTVQNILLGMIPNPKQATPPPVDTEPLIRISEGRKPAETQK